MARVLPLVFMFFSLSLFSQEITERNIVGKVVDHLDHPIPFANVYIKELDKGTAADEAGEFFMDHIPDGEWTITVSSIGYRTGEFIQSFGGDGTEEVVFRLDPGHELDQLEVFGKRNDQPEKFESFTRLPLNPYDQLQSISIISNKLIESQGNLTLSEATKNVPGVYTFATYGNKRESMSSRGFRGIPILKNGVRVHSDFRGVGLLTDMQGVDNIQLLKGSASITQGVATDLGSPGGIINIVTKSPKFYHGGSASLRVGSYGQVRPTFDMYGPLNKKKSIAYRLNGAYERSDSYRSMVGTERVYINPSLAWQIDHNTSLIMEMDYFYDRRTPDLGTVNLAEEDVNAIYDLPHSQFLGYDSDRSITKNLTYSVRLNRRLNDKLSLKGAYYHSGLELDDSGAGLGRAITQDGTVHYNIRQRNYSIATRSDDNTVIQLDLVGENLYTGTVKHTFQAGVDYRINDFTGVTESAGVLDTIDVFQMIQHRLPEYITDETTITGGKSHALGYLVQDVISWSEWLKTFVGIRYSSTKVTADDETNLHHAFNPLGGIVVSPIKNINGFLSYTNSSYPRTAARLGENGEELGNERFDQWEIGVKSSWLEDRLRFNLTFYKINNKNINLPVYDETWNNILYYAKGGNDQRQGVEVELTGRPAENIEVIAGYAFTDAQYKEHTSYVYGSAPLNTPKHTFNVYGNYSFNGMLEGLSFGGGAYYTGKRPINDWSSGPVTHEGIVPHLKPFDVDAYMMVNLQASYRLNDQWSVQFLLNNLFDTIGYNAYRTRFINQTDPRNFAGVVRYRF